MKIKRKKYEIGGIACEMVGRVGKRGVQRELITIILCAARNTD